MESGVKLLVLNARMHIFSLVLNEIEKEMKAREKKNKWIKVSN